MVDSPPTYRGPDAANTPGLAIPGEICGLTPLRQRLRQHHLGDPLGQSVDAAQVVEQFQFHPHQIQMPGFMDADALRLQLQCLVRQPPDVILDSDDCSRRGLVFLG